MERGSMLNGVQAATVLDQPMHSSRNQERLVGFCKSILQPTSFHSRTSQVANTSFRLYLLHQAVRLLLLRGNRIAAVGVMEVKDGQLCRISLLSGHYRPPVRNLRAFVHALKHDSGQIWRGF